MAGVLGLLFLSGFVFMPFAGGAAQTTWTNTQSSYSGTPPQIDATNFVNSATWNIYVAPYPYRTSDTYNYTNTGQMVSSVGWAFDLGPANSGSSLSMRQASGSFYNASRGVIQSVDLNLFGIYGEDYVSYLWVSATNVVNLGTLEAGSSGQILLNGTNGTVNLTRSVVEILPITPSSSGSTPYLTSPTNLVPAEGVFYNYWAQTNLSTLNSPTLWDGSKIHVPAFGIGVPCATNVYGGVNYYANSSSTFYYNQQTGFIIATNVGGSPINTGITTNYVHEVVFVIPPSSTANLSEGVRFTPSLNVTNPFYTVAVQLSQTVTNPVTLSLQNNTIYLVDVLASTTNGGFFQTPPNPNDNCSSQTLQPVNYILSRADVNLALVYAPYYVNLGNGYAYADGLPGVTGLPPTNFLYDTAWTNTTVSDAFAGLGATINSIAMPASPGASVSQGGGKVQIYSANLNLSRTRISGESWVNIQSKNLLDSAGAVVDCPNLSFDLGSTNGPLLFTNLAPSLVNRFRGDINAWSATWTNLFTVTYQTWYFVTNSSGGSYVGPTNATALAQANLYVMVLDASQLGEPVPVNILDLRLHATNAVNGVNNIIVIADPVSVTNSIFIDGPALVIQNSVGVGNAVQNWTWNNAPTLRYFTNNGSFTVPNSAHFGDDGPTNYMAFVNNGTVNAGALSFNSYDFENYGVLNAGVGCYITAASGKIQNGQIISGSDIQFTANNLKFYQSTNSANGGELDFNVANSLTDAGGSSGNFFTCNYGFNLWTKPLTGNLLGTTMNTVAPAGSGAEIYHIWAGANYGPANAGYSNNVALGQLVLSPQGSLTTYPPTFFFAGTNYYDYYGNSATPLATNGLYVDLLDLSALGSDWNNIQQNLLQIDPSLVIYYAAAKLGFTPPPAAPGLPPQEPEEFLDGQFGGHLRWVQTFAGPNSSVAVLINGQSYLVNKALRFATTIDSNSNGIPNYADVNPFNSPPPGSTPQLVLKAFLVSLGGQLSPKVGGQSSPSTVALSWLAVPNTAYNVQFTTNLAPANWQSLLTCTNNAATNQVVTVYDTNAPAITTQRFYRVNYGP